MTDATVAFANHLAGDLPFLLWRVGDVVNGECEPADVADMATVTAADIWTAFW
jgi:hypothetical protein